MGRAGMSAPLRVLIVRMGAMGDILHALPAVASMRAGLGEDAVIHWLVEPQWIDLLAVNDAGGLDAVNSAPRGESKPLVDVIVPADVKRWRKNLFSGETAREYLALRRRLSANNYDAAVDFQGAIKSASMAWLSGARFIVGPRTAREALADIFYTVKPEVDSEHVVDQAFDVTEAAVMMFHDDEWQTNEPFMPHPEYLPRDAAAEAWVDQQLTKLGITKDKRFALLTPGAGWPAKQWPAQKFGELAYTLVKEGMPCLINAAPVEAELAEEVVIASQDRARSVVCTLGQLIALTRRASVFVGG